jgi:hypothetical protein
VTDPVVLDAGEWTSDRIVEALEEGRRVVVHTTFMGSTYEVTMRWDGDTYYCDSPTRLYKHEDPEEFRGCLRRLGYSADADESDIDAPDAG